MKDWELTLRIYALGHTMTAESGFTCSRCGRTLSDILNDSLPCIQAAPPETEADEA